MLSKIIYIIQYKLFLKKWKKSNVHNYTIPTSIIPTEIVKIGNKTYGDLNIKYWNSKTEKLIIGHYVSIASGVTFILGGNHPINTMLTYPTCKIKSGGLGSYSKGPIIIEDDVWIGYNALILSGVKIGKGAVIGAGSVIAKDVPPYAVVVGNPGKIVKYRFTEDIIQTLLHIDYGAIDKKTILSNFEQLNQPLTADLLKKIKL